MAKEQMIRREKQLIRDGKLGDYNKEIRNFVDRGVVRILSPEEVDKALLESAWYLNHHMVERPDKNSTKLIIVFNSASIYRGECLNNGERAGLYQFSLSLFS